MKGNREISDSELDALIPQKPNRRLLGLPIFPYVGLYRFGQLFYNKEEKQRKVIEVTQNYQKESRLHENSPAKLEKIQRRYAKKLKRAQARAEKGNFWMRILGEEPVYFNLSDVEKNAEKMQKYLYNNGFFQSTVNFKPDTIFNRIRVQYLVKENRPTLLNNIRYAVNNILADSILKEHQKDGILVTKKRYDGDSFEDERIRIETLLRNEGYFGFSRQNVTYIVNDTITNPKTDSLYKLVDVNVRIDLPSGKASPERFTISSVNFDVMPPSDVPDSLFKKSNTTRQNINYSFTDKKFSTYILDSKIQVRPGEFYSQQKERDTQRQLSLTDQFRFINYSYKLDSTGHGIQGTFKAIPLDKYQFSTDVGLNVIQLQGAPGPFANFSYKIRNVFNGLENFETNIRGGIELVPGFISTDQIYRSEEIGINTSLLFPRLLVPGNLLQRKLAGYNPRTQVGLGYNFVKRPEYARTNVKAAMTYSWQPNNTTLYNLSLVDLNILNTSRLAPAFSELLEDLYLQGNNLKNSFLKSFVSDINFTYVHNTNPIAGPPKDARYFRLSLESGGTSLNVFPGQKELIKNIFQDKQGDLQFYKYLRWNADFRRYWRSGSRSSFVARINSGAIYSYGDNKVPPYEKYFFAGGSNSLRAWLPRRLGPGSSPPKLTDNNFSIEAPGEFLLEGNLEWRGHLADFFGDINYAFFIDAGNVWNIHTTDEMQELKANKILKDIAIGSGFGIRYDLSFFILRFDFGIKVIDPSRQKNQRFVLDEFDFQ
ncbi:BamA/TamA family outer membrane protein [Dyadobacter sp. NIV53]|uniref:translocation and assembly module lipoprotein TamL n=1 Tax=Dyadobacter sp. NIV53 TaxID=2861765 RepID=UPI001E479EFF|nr:BamA/TamA family outer membrane protein [Dyadobacter sp. NIV53]